MSLEYSPISTSNNGQLTLSLDNNQVFNFDPFSSKLTFNYPLVSNYQQQLSTSAGNYITYYQFS